jgi:hypothetical protein
LTNDPTGLIVGWPRTVRSLDERCRSDVMSQRGTVGRALSMTVLFVSGALGAFNGVAELSDTLTPLQRSVSTGVLIYGLAGLAGGIALLKRHRSAVWLATVWGIAVTYVSSVAALAYAPEATVGGAIASGVGSALIAGGVIWTAHRASHAAAATRVLDGVRATAIVLLFLASAVGIGACRQLYGGPPIVTDRTSADGLVTKVVRAKREPDRLIAQDLSVCWVVPDVFASIRAGDHWRCDWRHVPTGQ